VALPLAAVGLPTDEKPGKQRVDAGQLLQRAALPLSVGSGLAAIRAAYLWGVRRERARLSDLTSTPPTAAPPVAPPVTQQVTPPVTPPVAATAIGEQNQQAMTKLVLTIRNNDPFRRCFFGPEGLKYLPPVSSSFFFFFFFEPVPPGRDVLVYLFIYCIARGAGLLFPLLLSVVSSGRTPFL
jgi:hypothetical protein